MSVNIYEMLANGVKRRVAFGFRNFREAEYAARQAYFPVSFDQDADYPDCADFMACDGRLYAIEPEGFRP